MTFGERLLAAFDSMGHLCVGIDPHVSLLREWELTDDAAGLREFGLRVIEAAHARVGIVKPQAGFFERHGSAGIAALEDVIAAAHAADLLVIGDAKRGDIGSTMQGYAEGWLSRGASLEVDSLTVNGYLGVSALDGTADLARSNDNGLFVLAATSNPEGRDLQQARNPAGATVAASIVEGVRSWNKREPVLGSFGVVIGATVDLDAAGIAPQSLVGMPVLAPGFGHQGARIEDVQSIFGPAAAGVVITVSRSVLGAGREGVADAIAADAALARAAYSA